MKSSLTQRQESILVFIVEFIDRVGYPPTLEEVMRAFNIRSSNGVTWHLWSLLGKGMMQNAGHLESRSRGKSRNWIPTKEGFALARGHRRAISEPSRCPTCGAETFAPHPARLCATLNALEAP